METRHNYTTRKGEALGLQWRDLDLEAQTVNIIRNRTRFGTGTTKTKNSERKIKIVKNVTEQLIRYRIVINKQMLTQGRKLEDEDYIFLSLESLIPMPVTTLHKGYNRITERAGLKDCTLHMLRHSHATFLMNNGVPVRAIAERLGNTPEMIHTTYGHVLREMEDKIFHFFLEGRLIRGFCKEESFLVGYFIHVGNVCNLCIY